MSRPDWVQADPEAIDRSLQRALALPSGGWFAVDASRLLRGTPRSYRVAGRDLVLWRAGDGGLLAGPEACPHMGASLASGRVVGDRVVCPWHGLSLGDRPHGEWAPVPAYDDGVLAWVRLPAVDENVTDEPVLTVRPAAYLDGVVRVEAACDPRDVIANRLDPWHGTHLHPYAFSSLTVLDARDDAIDVRVAYRLPVGPAVEVEATFACPDPRTIAMTITAGEGAGSVVETHATPVEAGRTVILEATLATSPRSGFRHALRARSLLRPLIARAAAQLWRDDARYAERLFALRASKPVNGTDHTAS